MADSPKYLLVDTSVAPDVFIRVVHAKQLIAQGKASSSSQAAKMAGISRSAYYKYKDYVHRYDEHLQSNMATLTATLEDEPGVLSSVLACLYQEGANIITVNQNIPVDGVALVSVTVRIKSGISPEQLLPAVAALKGVIRVSNV